MSYARRSISIKDEEDENSPQEEEVVSIVLMRDAIVKVIGAHTGKLYTFSGAGSVIEMNKLDGEYLINKYIPQPSCCGSYSTPKFQIVGR